MLYTQAFTTTKLQDSSSLTHFHSFTTSWASSEENYFLQPNHILFQFYGNSKTLYIEIMVNITEVSTCIAAYYITYIFLCSLLLLLKIFFGDIMVGCVDLDAVLILLSGSAQVVWLRLYWIKLEAQDWWEREKCQVLFSPSVKPIGYGNYLTDHHQYFYMKELIVNTFHRATAELCTVM